MQITADISYRQECLPAGDETAEQKRNSPPRIDVGNSAQKRPPLIWEWEKGLDDLGLDTRVKQFPVLRFNHEAEARRVFSADDRSLKGRRCLKSKVSMEKWRFFAFKKRIARRLLLSSWRDLNLQLVMIAPRGRRSAAADSEHYARDILADPIAMFFVRT